jgi:hypothetical protein
VVKQPSLLITSRMEFRGICGNADRFFMDFLAHPSTVSYKREPTAAYLCGSSIFTSNTQAVRKVFL